RRRPDRARRRAHRVRDGRGGRDVQAAPRRRPRRARARPLPRRLRRRAQHRAQGIPFEGGAYPQSFVLGDVEADGPLEPGALNAFPARAGVALFFPLGRPTTWRLIGIEPPALRPPTAGPATLDLSLPQLQALADAATGRRVRLRD